MGRDRISRRDEKRPCAAKVRIVGDVLKSHAGTSFIQVIAMIEHYWKVIEFPVD